jgi:hypothetical protein
MSEIGILNNHSSTLELTREQRSLQDSIRLLNQRFLIRGSLLHYYFEAGSLGPLFKGFLRGHKIYKFRCLDCAEPTSRYLIRRSVRGNRLFFYDSSGNQLLNIEFKPKLTHEKYIMEYTIYNRDLLSHIEKDTELAVIRPQHNSTMEIKGLAHWSKIRVNQDENWLLFNNEYGSTVARMQQLKSKYRISSEMELYGCTRVESAILLLLAFFLTE